MLRSLRLILVVGVVLLAQSQQASSQESKAAKATREKLKQKISVEFKEIATKDVVGDIFDAMDKPVKFKILTATGISNNSKLSFKAKDKSVEQVLNELSDLAGFGWYVVSNPDNNKVDGWIMIRKIDKGKERGYEAGKEPKKTSALPPLSNERTVLQRELRVYPWHRDAIETHFRPLSAVNPREE